MVQSQPLKVQVRIIKPTTLRSGDTVERGDLVYLATDEAASLVKSSVACFVGSRGLAEYHKAVDIKKQLRETTDRCPTK